VNRFLWQIGSNPCPSLLQVLCEASFPACISATLTVPCVNSFQQALTECQSIANEAVGLCCTERTIPASVLSEWNATYPYSSSAFSCLPAGTSTTGSSGTTTGSSPTSQCPNPFATTTAASTSIEPSQAVNTAPVSAISNSSYFLLLSCCCATHILSMCLYS